MSSENSKFYMITLPLLIFSITVLLGSLAVISHLKSDVDTAWRQFDSEVENVNFLTEELRQNLTELRNRQKRQSYYETTAKAYENMAVNSKPPSIEPSENNCPAGLVGPKGSGLTGPDGDNADDVEDVYANPQCVMCPRGEPGPLGPRGPVGNRGPRGQIGRPGLDGENSAPGANGMVGNQGPPGNIGLKGQKGVSGRDAKRIRGRPGLKGKMGDIGPIGDEGWRGDDAVDGDLGDIGEAGDIGIQGRNGLSGEIGEGGDIGIQGQDAFYCPCPRRTMAIEENAETPY
ncbi:hypothetical protein WR25_17113 [Diploscapter pachys]|uniref:Nematode cuticle collagen N-terminal domain-containing protein n=1 Tax=Diploscapter pachys TaxID=2018661 RepID=A0A2A2LL33_9BILA|nr:hypothetical protein WR25_17113 [Diploscapter pachys]